MIVVDYKRAEMVVHGLTRYDYGQILEIRGTDVPDGTEVHFCQLDRAITQYMQSNQVLIPDYLLQYPNNIHVYVYHKDILSGETIIKVTLSVRDREKPGDYITPEEPAYSRILPPGGKDGQVLARGPDGYVWIDAEDLGDGFVTDQELADVAATVPQFASMREIEAMLNEEV
ncbi:hypothetical protein [Enterocloster citroniae]|uniref:Uncharacterized protein n=2 Tax=Enterocloster citroniae TaxID=358743 RepID=A0ABV2G3B6_9FIRM|nr:hypothetical protein [Enterocloster citroniae]KMW23680.1 hypothetical protein HMPREF9470_00896 [[Clostridium] citroniae WAL-19142]